MSIKEYSEEQLINLENNYRKAKKIDGGVFTLLDVQLELRRRNAGKLNPAKVYKIICKKSAISEDGLVAYLDIWQHFFPDKQWSGNNPRKIIGKALGGVIYYCYQNNFPLVNVLVVRKNSRELSEKAINNIWQECHDLRMEPGPDKEAFVLGYVEKAKLHAKSIC